MDYDRWEDEYGDPLASGDDAAGWWALFVVVLVLVALIGSIVAVAVL